jgi:hypothetical protein
MKALERRRKREEEQRRKSSMNIENSSNQQKKSISIQSSQSEVNEIHESSDKIENIPPSLPANNKDPEKVSQRMREKKEQRKRQKMLEAGIYPNATNSNKNNNKNYIENNNSNNPSNNNDSINRNNTFFNNKKYIIDKDSNKLVCSVESVAPAAGPKKFIKISSNKNIIADHFNLNNIFKQGTNNNISNSSDAPSTMPDPNYYILSKNIETIKNENVEDFLKKTQLEKPSTEQKESEVQKMINIMNLHPKSRDFRNNDIKYSNILTEKIEENEEYNKTKKEIDDLVKIINEEEKKIEDMQQKNKEEIQKYIEKILKLQNDLINSEQGDIVAYNEEDKIDKIQIFNLEMNLKRLEEENEKEKKNMIFLINKEILPLKKELKNEIIEVQKLKKQLLMWNKKTPPKDILKKIEVVMKYMKKYS